MNAQPQPTVAPFETWLDMPDRRLSPNARTHWGTRATLTKAARLEAYIAARDFPMKWHAVTARLTFHFPDNRRRDSDNLLARSKALFDGLVDAQLLTDDDLVTHLPVSIVHEPGCTPTVRVEIWPT